jgi:lipoprotein-releasing system ATP-binding protein
MNTEDNSRSGNKTLLRAKGIQKSYEKAGDSIRVLEKVDLELKSQEILAITGVSGAGKTTLLNILGTLDKADTGSLFYEDQDLMQMDPDSLASFRNKNLGFVFQFHHLLPEFSLLENVLMPAVIAGNRDAESREYAEFLLNEVGLGHRKGHLPSELSGGEQQRAAVARALIMKPKVVLADEPSGNLDWENRGKLHDLILQMSEKQKQAFIIVTHQRDLAEAAHRVLELEKGKLEGMA